jgi:beta-galactosidase
MYPNRVIVGSETHSTNIHVNWPLVEQYPHVIGYFTWVGWDYLGEAGIGRTEYVEPGSVVEGGPALVGPYPWIVANSGDLDIIGHRRPASYYREIVFGLRTAPYLAVQRPARYGAKVAYSGPWSWSDTVGSWSWPGFEGKPVQVEVYSADDEVELVLNGTSLGRQPAGRANKFRASFDTAYAPGELVAVGYRDGVSRRTTLVSAGEEVVLRAEAVAPRFVPTTRILRGDLAGGRRRHPARRRRSACDGRGGRPGGAAGVRLGRSGPARILRRLGAYHLRRPGAGGDPADRPGPHHRLGDS